MPRQDRPARSAGGNAAPRKQAAKKKSYSSQSRNASIHASAARLAALDTCRVVRERNAFAQEVIESRIDRARLSPEDRAFATLLVLGVVSTCGTLDEVIDRALRSPDDIKPDVRDALRISAYEMLFLGKEDYVAVDQGVELVRSIAPRATGVGNAALRGISRLKKHFPFGDPQTDDAALARSFGFPQWLCDQLIADLGRDAAIDLMEASNQPPALYVAENPLRASEGEVVSALEEAGASVSAVVVDGISVNGCWRVTPSRVLADGRIRQLIHHGKMLVSDASSQCVVQLALPQDMPESLLEIGAGRGTKTLLIEAEAQRRWGRQIPAHVTVDNHGFKTKLLSDRASTYGLSTVEGVTGDASHLGKLMQGRVFDCVLVDAPCSGLGTLRRHPEIRWRLAPQHIDDLAKTQRALLRSAAEVVAPGGSLIYATCTVTRKENLAVVKRFLESPAGSQFALAPIGGRSGFAPHLAPGSPDAHFAVRFVRKG